MSFKKGFLVCLATGAISVFTIIGAGMSCGNRSEQVRRGKQLVDLGGCNFCHTPKVMTSTGMELDYSKLLSGHPQEDTSSEYTTEAMNEDGQITKSNFHLTEWSGPWGISYAANLTPDDATGIGSWNEETFIKTLRTGRHMGSGRQIQLPMPVNIFAQLSDADLKAVFAYLRSIKPVKNEVPQSIPAGEENIGSSE